MAWCVLETDDKVLLSGQPEVNADDRGSTPTCLVQQCMTWCQAGPVPLLLPVSRRLAQPRLSAVSTLADCTGPVEHLAATRNGQHVFCGLENGQVDMYHLASRKLCHTFPGSTSGASCMELSTDGQVLVTGSRDCSVDVWQVSSPALLFRNRTHMAEVLCVAVSTISRVVVSGSRDCRFQLLDLDGGDLIHSEKLEGPVTSLSLNNCGTLLAIASGSARVQIWDLDDLTPLTSIDEGLTCPVQHIAITEDNTFLVAACEDNSLHVMSFTTGRALQRLSGHNDQVTCLCVCCDAVHALVGCSGGAISVFNIRSGQLLYSLRDHSRPVTGLTTTRDTAFILSAAKDDVHVWPFYKPHDHTRTPTGGQTGHVMCLAVAPDRDRLITGGSDSVVKLWSIDVCVTSADLEGHVAPITCVALARDEAFALSGSEDKTVKIWNIFSSSVIINYKGHSTAVVHVCILDDNAHVLTADRGGRLRLWGACDGVTLHSLSSLTSSLTLSPDDCHFGVIDRTARMLQLWRVWDGVSLSTLSHGDKITCVAFSPDSRHVVTGCADRALRVWEVDGGLLTQVLSAHEAALTSVTLSNSDTTHVLSGSADGGLLVWCLDTGRLLHRLTGHTNSVTAVRTTDTQNLGVSGSLDGTLRVWGISQGVQLSVYALHAPIFDVQLTCSGSHVITKLEQHVDRPLLCFHLDPSESKESLKGITSPGVESRPLLIPVQLPVFPASVKGPRPRPIRLPTIPDIMQVAPQKCPFSVTEVELQQDCRKPEIRSSNATTNNNRPSKDWMSTICTIL